MTLNTKRPAPVSTTTLPALLAVIGEPRSGPAEVAEVVATDAGLAARVLAVANSAQYGLGRSVSDLRQAIVLIGTSMVQTLAIASASSLLDTSGPMAERREHALDVACVARRIAPLAGATPADAFAAGLLHDVGELLLFQAKPKAYLHVVEADFDHAGQLRTEKAMFGMDHALLGAEHLLDWRLPDVIADAVADHHDPLPWSDACTLVVAAADEIVHADPGRRHALDLLGLSLPSELIDAIDADRAELEALLVA